MLFWLASQKIWQNWKLAMLQFDAVWNIEPVKVLNAILLTIDAEDPRINGWFETQDRAAQANLKVTMSEFCDYVLRQAESAPRHLIGRTLLPLHEEEEEVVGARALTAVLVPLQAEALTRPLMPTPSTKNWPKRLSIVLGNYSQRRSRKCSFPICRILPTLTIQSRLRSAARI